MKKIVFVLLCFLFLCCRAHATSSFYIGYNVDNLRYVKNKNGKLVYSDFKTIHKNGSFYYADDDSILFLITCSKKYKNKQVVFKGILYNIVEKSVF